MAIVKSATPNPVAVGGTLHYTLYIANSAAAVAHNVTVMDTLPSNVTVVSVNTSQGTATTSSSGVEVQLGTMQENANATVTIDVTVSKGALHAHQHGHRLRGRDRRRPEQQHLYGNDECRDAGYAPLEEVVLGAVKTRGETWTRHPAALPLAAVVLTAAASTRP